jgi:hypothetical protein
MSYTKPIDLSIVNQVIDDLEDANVHTLCALLRAFYFAPGHLPYEVANAAYDAAKEVIHDYYRSKAAV